MNALAISLQTYFTTFAHTQRDLSINTIASYRDTWRMLLKYLTTTLGIPADALDFDAVTATHVTGFLDHLEQERGNSSRTRNARLTAIRSVLGRALPDHPEHAATSPRSWRSHPNAQSGPSSSSSPPQRSTYYWPHQTPLPGPGDATTPCWP